MTIAFGELEVAGQLGDVPGAVFVLLESVEDPLGE